MKILEQTAKFLAEKLTAVSRKITVHTENHGNPHGVTKAQVGLGNADNTSDADKPLSAAQMEALGTMNGTISGHVAEASIHKTSPEIRAEITEADIPATLARIGDVDSRIVTHNKNPEAHADIREKIGEQIAEHTGKTDNPHRVTAAQVGLGNADNTSDADKPVSSATAAEIAAVRTETASRLNTKVDKQEGYGLSSNDYSTAEKKKLGHLGEYVRKCTFKRNTSSTHHYLRCETWDPAVGGENEILCEVPQVNETADGFCTPGMKTIIDGLSYGSGTLNAQGTPSALWNIGTPGGPSLKASGGQMEVRNAADTAYADLSVRDLSVKGNLAVEGESFIVNTQTVEVADNTILLNRGEVGAGVTKGIAGLEIDRGSEEKYKIIFDESDDRVKVGKGNDLWPVMLRDKDADLTAGNILIWDAAAKRAVSGKNIDTELSAYALKTDLDPLQTKTGDTRDNTVTFTEAAATENIGSGEKHTVIFGKIRKWFSSLGTLAFRNTVSIPEVDNLQNTLDGKETVFAKNTAFNKNFGSTADSVCEGNDPRLSDVRLASGGNADTVDGKHADEFVQKIGNQTIEGDLVLNTQAASVLIFNRNGVNKGYIGLASPSSTGIYISNSVGGSNINLGDNGKNYSNTKEIATTDQIPMNAAKLTYLSDVWGLPSDVNGASGGWIRTPGNGLLPFSINTADGSGSVGSTDWPFRTMHAKTFHGNLDGTATNADKLSGLTTMDLIPEDKSASIMAANTAMNMHGFGYTRNGFATNGSFISFGGVGNKYHTQLQGSYEFDNLYFRTYNSDVDQLSFHPWKKLATTEDIPHTDGFIQNSGTVKAPVIKLKDAGNNISIVAADDAPDGTDYIVLTLGLGNTVGIAGGANGDLYLRSYSRDQILDNDDKRVCTKVFVSDAEPAIPVNESFVDGDIWVQL